MEKRKILIAAAWPYGNNSMHLGNLSSILPADVLARYHRLCGDDVLYVSGTDCHGTPITITAEKEKTTPEAVADKYHKEFCKGFLDDMDMSYDCYTTTTTENHKKVVSDLFLKLLEKEFIYKKKETLPFCTKCNRFLLDRYIEGVCGLCGALDARGDQCDACGEILEPSQLKNPKCKLCESVPEERETENFYLKLSAFQKDLEKFVKKSSGWRKNALKMTESMLSGGLKDRAITRDIEWGISVPVEGYEKKKIYVWFEAVIGYLSASCEARSDDWKEFWENKDALHYYLHGKDNVPFHTVIWPAMLIGYGGLHLPDRIFSSEYLNFENKSMSKSKGWAVFLKDFIKDYNSDTLRYYLIAAGPETSDSNYSHENYKSRTNNELIATFGNFVNRSVTFVDTKFSGSVSFPMKKTDAQEKLLECAKKTFSVVSSEIEKGNFRSALALVFELARVGNKYLDDQAPWKKIKDNPKEAEFDLAVVMHVCLCLATLIEPFLPKTSKKMFNMFGSCLSVWEYPEEKNIKINTPEVLFDVVE